MSNVDPRTFGWKRPRTLDGRRYPLHLRAYEQHDTPILTVLAQIEPATYDDIVARNRRSDGRCRGRGQDAHAA